MTTDPQSLPVELPPIECTPWERGDIQRYARAYATACVLAEREACAALCNDTAEHYGA